MSRHLDPLAEKCCQTFDTISICTPSRASFLTGRYAGSSMSIGMATHFSRPNNPQLVRGAIACAHSGPTDGSPV
jgi:arylsulfatase A-like enzyme